MPLANWSARHHNRRSGVEPIAMPSPQDRFEAMASQLPVANWYDVIGEETIADAILDRLVHSSYRIELKGESLRKKQ